MNRALAIVLLSFCMGCGGLVRELFGALTNADAGVGQPDAAHALCVLPEDCPSPTVCQRLSGACVAPSPALCTEAVTAESDAGADVSDWCYLGVREIPGCGSFTPHLQCRGLARCAAMEPFATHQAICGSPLIRVGICRTVCDPCQGGAGCPAGQVCMADEGIGGVCFSRTVATSQCGLAACAPDQGCVWGAGSLNRCERVCLSDSQCLPGTLCGGMPDADYCQVAQSKVGVGEQSVEGVSVCDSATSFAAVGLFINGRCVAKPGVDAG